MQSLNEVLKLSKKHNVIPLFKETMADLETPLSAYMKIDNPEYSFLLESVEGGENIARHSYLSREPVGIVSYKDGKLISKFKFKGKGKGKGKEKEKVVRTKDPLSEMQKIFRKFKVAPAPGLPARGGAVGYVGYDIVKLYDKVPVTKQKDDLKWPDMFFMFYDVLMIFDHVLHKIKVVYSIHLEKGDKKADVIKKYKKAVVTIDNIIKNLKKPLKIPPSLKLRRAGKKVKIKHHMSKEKYKKGVKEAGMVLRAHRLWETYLERIGTPETEVHATAHQLEHLDQAETLSYLDKKLGSPKTDPHGSAIPEKNSL